MSRSSFLNTFDNYSVEQFIEFLKNNGLAEYETISIKKNLDGHTFLNLAEFEIKNWRPHLSSYQAHKFWSFLNLLKTSPESFVFVAPPKPAIPAKPVPNKDHLQKLSENPSFLSSLRAAVQNRAVNKKIEDVPNNWNKNEDVKQHTSINSTVAKQVPLPPRPPVKKPQLPPVEYEEIESQDDEESVYVSPDDSSDDNFKAFSKKSLPEIPQPTSPPPQVIIRKMTPLPDPPKVTEEVQQGKAVKRQPFRLGDHYNRQREREREIAKTIGESVQNLVPNRKIPPKDVSPRRAEKVCAIPRPPANLVKADLPDLPDLPEPQPQPEDKSVPMEQESYYRYTDRKGAEDLLSEEFADGTYLIRPSRAYHATLSVRQGDKVYHIGVKKIEGNLLEIASVGLDLKFKTLNEMITYFRHRPITVKNRYNEFIEIYLHKTLPEHRT